MRLFRALLGVATVIGLAAPAHAAPVADVDEGAAAGNATFLASLHDAGITYGNPDQAVSAAQAMCGLIDRGESGLQVIQEIRDNNPGFSIDDATHFAAIAARSYCPQQLTKKAK